MTKHKLYRHSPYDKQGNKGYWNDKVKRLLKSRKPHVAKKRFL